jgi:hypothetical protein
MVTKTPTFTATQTPTFTATILPSRTPTETDLPTPAATRDFCSAAEWQDEIYVVSSFVFVALRPGGPSTFDRILIAQNPAWAGFRQEAYGEIRSAGVIFHETSFGPELGTGVNPAVVLVTYGVALDWELPADGDLVSQVDQIREALIEYEHAWILGQVDRTQFPPIANGATYALYRLFEGEMELLEAWCHTFVQEFSESPLQSN